jgi:transposase
MKVQTIGIDLGKTVFHVVGLDKPGNVVVKKRFPQTQVIRNAANLPTCLIGMEACCGAHHLGAVVASTPDP